MIPVLEYMKDHQVASFLNAPHQPFPELVVSLSEIRKRLAEKGEIDSYGILQTA
jgi:effector-binding domain-containing protein